MGSSTQVYFNERKVMLKLQFILGMFKNRLGSSIAYYQAQQQKFWAFQEAWEQTPKASPSSKLVKMANFAYFWTKIAEIFRFSRKTAQQNYLFSTW